MTQPLQIPPPGTPLIGADGGLALIWRTFFNTVVTRLGGANGGLQPQSDNLDGLSELNAAAGLLVQTGADAFTKRSLAVTAGDLTVSNPAGTAGNPTLGLAAVAGVAGVHASPTNITIDSKGRVVAIS